jgi:hypothetical protein
MGLSSGGCGSAHEPAAPRPPAGGSEPDASSPGSPGGAPGGEGQDAAPGGAGGTSGSGGSAGGGGSAGTPDAAPVGDGSTAMPMPEPTPEEPLPPCKRTVDVANSGALASAIGTAQAGDCIVMADGSYTFPGIAAKGTMANPIVIRAANTLMAVVSSGDLSFDGAAFVVVQGLTWNGSGVLKLNNVDHVRVSRFRIQRKETGAELDWITVGGTSKYARLDHNDIGPQQFLSNMVMIAGAGNQISQNTRIDHNFFHDVHYTTGNGWEIIRNGLSGWTFSSAHSLIEQNLFKATASDPEVISVKSSDNVIRYNTMRASAGQFVLRHGNRSEVYGNYIIGDGVAGSGGIRIHGGEHKIYNNYIAGVGTFGINVEGGESTDMTGALTDHKQVYGATIAFNTVVNDQGIEIGGSHPLGPINCTIAYNLLQGSGMLLTENAGSQNNRYLGNIASGGMVNLAKGPDAVRMIDANLTKIGDVFRIGMGSPAVDAGDAAMFPFVTDDIDGKPRTKPDVGADEWSMAPAKFGLLKESDVGPLAP